MALLDRLVRLLPGLALLLGLALPGAADADRLKDLASVRGVSDNSLVGYGLVVGLAGTGDNLQSSQTQQMMANILSRRFGTIITPQQIRARNVAVVMVTARMPAFARVGSRIDVTVSSTSNAKSLFGGTLLPTALKGGNGAIYAWSEGPVSIGGFSADGASGSSVSRNHPTAGTVPGGGLIAKEVGFRLSAENPITFSLRDPDFTTAARAVEAINTWAGRSIASTPDPGSVVVRPAAELDTTVVSLVAALENLDVVPDHGARVVVNEKTGTIVMGSTVHLYPCAISHGGLTVQVSEQPQIVQPNPLSGGQTAAVPRSDVQITEDGGWLQTVGPGTTLGEVVHGLNALGVRPRDLVAILLAMRQAGALRAEIEIQ
jgi:flagellar P-ring protein precursor FlgI